jgi:tetratricopeptide (TPR) repeat protein
VSAVGQDWADGLGVMDDPLLGGGLPPAAQAHLDKAGLCYHQSDVAETHLLDAARLAPDHAAVLIAFYRFYFYKGRLIDALDVARQCLAKALADNVLGEDWLAVQPDDADFADWGALRPRFFLFTLKAYAYLNMRLGRFDEGRLAAEKLLFLDRADRIGARVLIDVLERMEAGDE